MANVYIYSKIFLKSGNIAEITMLADRTGVHDLEKEVKEQCQMLSKIYIGKHDTHDITWGNLEIVKGMFSFNPDSVEAAIVTYEILDAAFATCEILEV